MSFSAIPSLVSESMTFFMVVLFSLTALSAVSALTSRPRVISPTSGTT